MSETIRPVLAGQKALVVGVANKDSIAYGCAKTFATAGSDLAITWLNDRARPHVEPMAQELGASITGDLDVYIPGQLEAVFEQIAVQWGRGYPDAFHCLCAEGGSSGRAAELLRRGVRAGDGYLLPFLRADGEAGGAAYD